MFGASNRRKKNNNKHKHFFHFFDGIHTKLRIYVFHRKAKLFKLGLLKGNTEKKLYHLF
jgi:hypothetical protein